MNRHLPWLAVLATMLVFSAVHVVGQSTPLLNKPLDISGDFEAFENTLFVARRLSEFDPQTAKGRVTWQQSRLGNRFQLQRHAHAPGDGGASRDLSRERIRRESEPAVLD